MCSFVKSVSLTHQTMMQAALLLEFWDSAKPKFDPESLGRQPRPQLPVLPDVEPVQMRAVKDTDQSASQ